ncbi:TlpA disulfide reductase family protein [Pseudodesulfovibrio sp. zrk46]|uniref:TlpA family protein disulfide reductase n=1 Tax=Pseudodesulfovibrio sp. zrk46 TaxID=2725288 RepID=UPI00144948C3|nr:TlpA disulfide reductase family protein [Pseudodesulfovibrio sp. zrk46]QJB56252.1 TlpA family protein disulfide reductase [Pseudodesulfovibrio sp. zrk46]
MKNIRRFAVILMICMLLMACGDNGANGAGTGSESASVAAEYPPMGVKDLDAFLAANKGTPVMLMFWTTWCPSCKEAVPELEKLSQAYNDKVKILAVSLDESKDALDAFFAKKKLDLPVYHGDQAIAQKFGVEAIPTLLMFDKNGKQVFGQPGVFPYEMLKIMADKLMAQ